MANDIIEFAKCKEDEKLRELAKAIELASKSATQENHKFLAYLLEMAHIEAKALLDKAEQERPESS